MMPGSVRLLRFRGIDLNIHYSLLVLLVYVVLVASVQIPAVAAAAGVQIGELSGNSFAWGLVFSLGLFASIAVHEFGHSLVAQGQGVPVKDITLMMLGGMSHLERMPEKPYSEFKLAIIGPIVSLALAGGFFWIYSRAGSPNIVLLSYWLGTANFVLAVFNLLPAFPLDGGRAMRSILAARRGMVRGTETAVRVSRVMAWILGGLGLLQFNLILLLIAFFIYSAAQTELVMVLGQNALKGVKVVDALARVPSVTETSSVAVAADQMVHSRQIVLPVRTSARMTALVSLERIRLIARDAWDEIRVREVQEPVKRALSQDENLGDVFLELATSPRRILPVQDLTGEPVGLLRYTDVMDLIKFRTLQQQGPDEDQGSKAA